MPRLKDTLVPSKKLRSLSHMGHHCTQWFPARLRLCSVATVTHTFLFGKSVLTKTSPTPPITKFMSLLKFKALKKIAKRSPTETPITLSGQMNRGSSSWIHIRTSKRPRRSVSTKPEHHGFKSKLAFGMLSRMVERAYQNVWL